MFPLTPSTPVISRWEQKAEQFGGVREDKELLQEPGLQL